VDAPQPPPQEPGPWGEPSQWPAPQTATAGQPPSIRLAVRLMWLGAALSVLGIFFSLAQRDETRDLIADANPSYSESQLDTETDAAMTRAVVGALIAAGLWLLMAQTNGKGRPWARIVATVLGAINGLFLLLFLVAGLLTGLGVVSALASLVLAVTILMLLYRPESNRYYDVMSGRTGY
jgi:hypothetical protein